MKFYDQVLYWASKAASLVKTPPHLRNLETTKTEIYFRMGNMLLIKAFRHISRTHLYYKHLLKSHNIDPRRIRTVEDFVREVPVVSKEQIFEPYSAKELAQNGIIDDFVSAIVTSGSSGNFAYSLLTEEDVEVQRTMVDAYTSYILDLEGKKPMFIGALSMGVTFVSKYPVILTGVRTDIVVHVIKKLSPYREPIIIGTDPHLAKKIIEEGEAAGLVWSSLHVFFVVGSLWPSASLLSYIQKKIQPDSSNITFQNGVICTMGLTEVGLNAFFAPQDLVHLRLFIQNNPVLMEELFGANTKACPEILYYIPTQFYVELIDKDNDGFGTVVLSTLDMEVKTMLMRYNTGDIAKMVERPTLFELLKKHNYTGRIRFTLPIIAVVGRKKDYTGKALSVNAVKEALYRDADVAEQITGHFKIVDNTVHVHAQKGVVPTHELAEEIKSHIHDVSGEMSEVTIVPYAEFDRDMELNYENKWKHL